MKYIKGRQTTNLPPELNMGPVPMGTIEGAQKPQLDVHTALFFYNLGRDPYLKLNFALFFRFEMFVEGTESVEA